MIIWWNFLHIGRKTESTSLAEWSHCQPHFMGAGKGAGRGHAEPHTRPVVG